MKRPKQTKVRKRCTRCQSVVRVTADVVSCACKGVLMPLPVSKRCARCKHVALVKLHDNICREPRFGKGSYACGGQLVIVARRKSKPKPKSDDPSTARYRAHQSKVATQTKRTSTALKAAKQRLRNTERAVAKLEHRLQLLAKHAAQTPADVDARHARAVHAATIQSAKRRLAKSAGVPMPKAGGTPIERAMERAGLMRKTKRGTYAWVSAVRRRVYDGSARAAEQ